MNRGAYRLLYSRENTCGRLPADLLIDDGARQRFKRGLPQLQPARSDAVNDGAKNRVGGFQMADGGSHALVTYPANCH